MDNKEYARRLKERREKAQQDLLKRRTDKTIPISEAGPSITEIKDRDPKLEIEQTEKFYFKKKETVEDAIDDALEDTEESNGVNGLAVLFMIAFLVFVIWFCIQTLKPEDTDAPLNVTEPVVRTYSLDESVEIITGYIFNPIGMFMVIGAVILYFNVRRFR